MPNPLYALAPACMWVPVTAVYYFSLLCFLAPVKMIYGKRQVNLILLNLLKTES
jgi:hypothetical protein